MTKKTITIIGGGVAGLSAGIYGRLNGFDTTIYEMHSRPGGQCTAWDREGYRFDYCINWLAGSSSGEFHKLYRETHALEASTPVYMHPVRTRLKKENGEEFLVYANLDDWEKYMIAMAPEDTAAIKKMCSDMKKASYIQPFSAPPELRSMQEWFHKAVALFPVLPLMRKYRRMDAATYIRLLKFKNHDLRFFLSKLFSEEDFSALSMLLMAGWFHAGNAGYPAGGSLPMTERMTAYYDSLGGKLITNSKVKRIIVKNRRAAGVVLENGERISSDIVISACDGYNTIYNMLKGRFRSREIDNAYTNGKLFTPIVQVSLGINRELRDPSPATIHLTHKQHIGSTDLHAGYSITNYSLMDRSMAPAGKTTLILRYESPWNIWKNMKDKDYQAEKEAITRDILPLLEKHYPGIGGDIDVMDIATPLTSVKYTGVYQGAYEGFMPDRDPTRHMSMTLPGLADFYLIGQWIIPGGGLPPSIQTGKWVIQYICHENRRIFRQLREHLREITYKDDR